MLGVQKKVQIASKYPLAPLSEVTSGFTGVVFDKGDESQTETDLKILTASNIDLETKSLVFEKSKNLKKFVTLNENDKLKRGDIFVCMSSGSLGHLGKFVFIENDIPYWAGGFCAVLRGGDYQTQKYISTILDNFNEYRNFVESFSGQNINNLKLSDLLGFRIPLPQKPVQEKILNEIIVFEKQEKAGRKKAEKLKEEIEQLITFHSTNGVVKKLGEICEMKAGKFVSPTDIFPSNDNNELYPCYGGNGQRGYTKSFTHDGKYSLIGRQGALCGNVNIASGKFHATEHAIVVTAFPKINTDWLYYLLRSLNLNQYAKGAAQPGLSVTTIKAISVNVLSLPEQEKIVSQILKLEKQISAIENDLSNIESEKKNILKKYLE